MKARYTRAMLLALILLAFALRLYEIDAQSFWYDEGVTAQVAQLGVRELATWTANDIQPPLYYLLVGGWLRFNPFGEGILRWPSAAFGTLLVPLLWCLGRRLWNDRAGLLAALVGTTSPLMVYYSQEARMYSLLVMLVALAALVLVRLLARGMGKRSALLIVYTLVGVAALYTHYFAIFALFALAFYWGHIWWRTGREMRRLGEFVAANGLILLGYLPWLPAMIARFAVDSSYWSGSLKLGEAMLDVAMNFSTGATEVMLEGDGLSWLLWFGLAALLWLLAITLGGYQRRQRPLALVLLWLLIPTILILALAYRTPKFNPRYLMVSWPAWALLAGGGIMQLWSWPRSREGISRFIVYSMRTLALLSAALLLLAHTQGLMNWYADDNFAKSAWREAIMEMYANRQTDETVLLVSGHSYPVFDTYIPSRFNVERHRLPDMDILDVNQVLGWEDVAKALNDYLGGKRGVWLFLWQDDVVDPTGVTITLLNRYAKPQPVPNYAYVALKHYRLQPGQTFPERPPIVGPGVDFGEGLRLAGVEASAEGLWFYWQALQDDLPDIRVAMTVSDESGQVLLSEDGRPAGYNFPTMHWQVGDTYPSWHALAEAERAVRVHLVAYEALTGERIAERMLPLQPGGEP